MDNEGMHLLKQEIDELREQVTAINMSKENLVARPTVVYLAARMETISREIYTQLDALWREVKVR